MKRIFYGIVILQKEMYMNISFFHILFVTMRLRYTFPSKNKKS